MSKIAYKGFRFKSNKNNQLYCRNMIYELDKEYVVDGNLKLCYNGMHFCWKLRDVNRYYDFDESTICEVEILGDVIEGYDKACTNKLKILRILSKEEVMELSNKGVGNVGYCNDGNGNEGNWNTGNDNKGDHNDGNDNKGIGNVGDGNKGNINNGSYNKGNNIIGFFNTISAIGSLDNIAIFNKLSNISMREFNQMGVYKLLCDINYDTWAYTYDTEKELIYNLPNFDKDIFDEIIDH